MLQLTIGMLFQTAVLVLIAVDVAAMDVFSASKVRVSKVFQIKGFLNNKSC